MSKPDYERIYLVPEDGVWCWAETPAPGAGQSNADAVEYVRADLYQAQSTQVESLLDDRKEFVKKEFQHLKEIERLEIELKKRDEQNAALAAQVEALQSRVGTAERVEAIFNQAPEISFDDCVKLFPDDLREIRALAIESAAQKLRFAPMDGGQRWAIRHSELLEHAESIRQGGAA